MKEGWEVCELQKHIRLIDYRGRTPKKTDSGVKLITAKNVKLGYLQNHPEEFIAEDSYEDWMRRGIPEYGDVIFTTEAPLANVAQLLTHEKVAFAQRTIVMQPEAEVLDKTFLKYLLLSPETRDTIFSKGTGATVTGIKSSLLKRIQIPIPPLTEQKQIVAILDKAFAAIDQAKANIEKNIENAKELFQSKLNEIFSQPARPVGGKGEGSASLADKWEEKNLGEIAYVKSGGTPSRSKKEYWDNGVIPWYSSGELNEIFTITPERYITQEGLDNSNAKLFSKGSLLIGMYDTAALKMSIIDRVATFNQAIAGVEPNDKLDLIFILHAINAIKPELLKQRRGVRQKNLSLTKIKEIRIGIPDLVTQKRIVEELSNLKESIGKLIYNLDNKVTDLEELKKSILQKAFSGELTA